MKETMTSRERVLSAFNRVKADRVPINYSANEGIHKRLKDFYGVKQDDNEALNEILGVDFRGIISDYNGPQIHEDIPNRSIDLWGNRRRWIEHDSGGYWDFCDFPLSDADEETVANWPMPNPDHFDYSHIPDTCKKYDKYAQALYCYGDLINGNGMVRGMEQTLIDLVTDDPAGILLADRRFEIQTRIAERILDAAKGRIDFLWLGEDLGTQDRPMISMEIFREHIKPRFKKLVDLANSYGCKTMIHTCGSSSWAYDDFIEIGINAVDTLQPECKNMSPEYLVEHFGGRLSFHGCLSTAGKLAFGTPEEVRQEVKDILEIMMPTNSYMFSPTHSIQDNSPTENVVAMYESVKEFGWFK